MKVALRTDASGRIGTGHLMRCLTLADTLRAGGARTRFVCRPTRHALETADLQHDYYECWQGLRKHFGEREA